jgi:hypothetical protein
MFKLIKIENGRQNVPEPEYLEVTASEAVELGEALVLNAGKLTKCGTTTAPAYIAMGAVSAGETKRVIAACRVEPNQIYEVECTGTHASLHPGEKVALSEDGLGVTYDKTSGVATVVSAISSSKSGDKITVRF